MRGSVVPITVNVAAPRDTSPQPEPLRFNGLGLGSPDFRRRDGGEDLKVQAGPLAVNGATEGDWSYREMVAVGWVTQPSMSKECGLHPQLIT